MQPHQTTKKKIESTRKHRRLGSKFCDRLPTTMARARKQRKYINRHINIIKIRGKKTRHLPYINCPLILPTKTRCFANGFCSSGIPVLCRTAQQSKP